MKRAWVVLLLGLAACEGLRSAAMMTTPTDTFPDTPAEGAIARSPTARAGDASVLVPVADGGTPPIDPTPPRTCDGGPCAFEHFADAASPWLLAGDENNIYFDDGTHVVQCPKTGCATGRLVLADVTYPNALAAFGGNVYWTTGDRIESVAVGVANQTPTVVIAGQTNASQITTDGAELVWSLNPEGLLACPLGACTAASVHAVAPGETDQPIVLLGNTVFWSDEDGVLFSCPLTGCPDNTWTQLTVDVIMGLSSDGTNLFWTDKGPKLFTCPAAGCTSPAVFATTTAPQMPGSDGVHVFWRDGVEGKLYRCPLVGCPPTGPEVATDGLPEVDIEDQLEPPLLVDQDYVYWLTQTGIDRWKKE